MSDSEQEALARALPASGDQIGLICPFCKECEFDEFGLQLHLMNRDCPNYGLYNDRNKLPGGED